MNPFIRCIFSFIVLLLPFSVEAQQLSADDLFLKLRSRLEGVRDYVADVNMTIDVSFMRVPALKGKLYFKHPDKLKLERNGGIAILPRKSVSLTLNNLIPSGRATVIDAGQETVNGIRARIIKVIPETDESDIVLTRIWVDEHRLLALRTETTTRESGTMKMDLRFGKFAHLALPDQITFFVDVKELKLPKGVTMDYDAGGTDMVKKKAAKKSNKGTIRINYLSYKVNTGLSDKIFADPVKE